MKLPEERSSEEMADLPSQSPFLVKFFDSYVDEINSNVCLVLEYMNNGSLQDLIDTRALMSERDVCVVAYSMASALTDLHSRGILHRDIKVSGQRSNITFLFKSTHSSSFKNKHIIP